ncbi:HoxN/HupN/NixA family nickel/cobalt transporter [Micrococcales bacterium 31B]|nr:HoxN/HupN/NixA family nickel/cobalt transporter [Micrococcales bacterium 31B]
MPASRTPPPPHVVAPQDLAAATAWRTQDTRKTWGMYGVIALMHVVAFGVVFLFILPRHDIHIGGAVFSIGLALTAYTLGARHAFDPDHIAVVDNVTRKLAQEGRRPVSVGFFFALGHSTIVTLMALCLALGVKAASGWVEEGNPINTVLGLFGTTVSGVFLYLIAAFNLFSFVALLRVRRKLRRGAFDEHELEYHLHQRGLLARLVARLTARIKKPGHMYPVGFLFGLGFDTASEISLLVLAGTASLAGVPWYAIMVLPLLFTAGMTLFDALDGTFMNFAYQWAFKNPVRKVYYNLMLTGISIVVAFFIGTVNLAQMLIHQAHWSGPVADAVNAIDMENYGFYIVGIFLVCWLGAVTYWKLGNVEEKWAPVTST